MTNTYDSAHSLENVQTRLLNNNEEKVKYIISDCMVETRINHDFEYQNGNKREKKSLDLGRKLFHNARFTNTFYSKTQKWIGHIVEINDDGFKAILKDITNGGTDEYGEFSNDEITKDDLELVSMGASFYMSLGFISINGARKRESEIRFQRLVDFNEDIETNNGLDLVSDFINYF